MSKTPFMPLWNGDLLADTLEMDATEFGAFMLLIIAQWQRKGESLPSDEKRLQRVARVGRAWPKIWANIQRFFDTDDQGVYSRKCRILFQNVALKTIVNSQNGARGGVAKALKNNNTGLANAKDSLKRNSSISEPEPYIREEPNGSLSFHLSPQPDFVDEISQAIASYNASAEQVGWPKVQAITAARRASMKARLVDSGGLSGWDIALAKARASPHLCGQNDRGWTASFDFLTSQKSFAKLMEGNYDAKHGNSKLSGSGASGTGPTMGDALAFAARRKAAQRSGSAGGGGGFI